MKVRAVILLLSGLFLAACEEKGPAQSLGERIDEGVSEARDATEGALESLGDSVERAADDFEDAAD